MGGYKAKIRGIYSTALTKLLLDNDFCIVQPSTVIAHRLSIEPCPQSEEVSIYDRADHQGITVEGDREAADSVISILKETLFDVIIRPTSPQIEQKGKATKLSWHEFVSIFGVKARFDIELPYNSKYALDAIRAKICPTLADHHLLKVVDCQRVDEAEKSAQSLEEAAANLKQEIIYDRYQTGRVVPVEHVSPEGSVVYLKGKIMEFIPQNCAVKLKRSFAGRGGYDGLHIPQQEGDWGLVEVEAGSWICKRSYYRKEGHFLGEIYNINTPAEFYPDGIRYIDLKVDVVRYPSGEVEVIDQHQLRQAAEKGIVSEELANKAMALAEELKNQL
mgnify:CR=1 FL=1